MGSIIWRLTAALIAGVVLTACGEEAANTGTDTGTGTGKPRDQIIAEAATRMPADAALAETYQYSCYTCHADPQNAAPLSGDEAAWAARVESKGMDGLLDSTINGFAGMPPLGMCVECSRGDFEALIRFMAAGAAEDAA